MPATPYYVDGTNGLDTNDGTTLVKAWKTIHKAITTIADDLEAICYVSAGTYAETSGSGYLAIQQERTALLTIESATGNAEDVVITAASGDTYTVYLATGTTAYLKFSKVTIQSRTAVTAYLVAHHANAVLDNLTFADCRFVLKIGGTGTSRTGIYIVHATDVDVTNLSITGCTFITSGTQSGTETVIRNLVLSRTHADAQLATVTVTGNVFQSPISCVSIYGATVLDFSNNTVTAGSGTAVAIGQDDATNAQATSGTVAGNWIRGATSHGLLIGYGCTGVAVSGNHVCGGNIGLVVKDCTLVTVTGNYVEVGTVGTSGGLVVKGGTHSLLSANVVVCRAPATAAVQVRFDSAPTPDTKYHAITCRGNVIIAMADANCIDWGESAAEEDAEESVCDNNTLYQLGTGDLGTVKGSVCTTLAELITAWSAYTITTNDAYTALGTADMLSSIGLVGPMRMGIGL